MAEPELSTPSATAPTRSNLLALPLRPRWSYPLACATGVLYFLAFPGIDLWPLSLVALAPMVIALEQQRPKHALLLGLTAGFTMNVLGFYWLYGMLKTFSGFPGPICLLLMCILCAYQGGRIALCGWLHGLARAKGWPRIPVFLLAFAASELVFPLLFPWYFGACVHNAPALAQVAELGGPYLVGLVLAAPALAVAEWAIARLEATPAPWRTMAVLAAVPVVAASYGALRIHQVDARVAAAPAVKVGVVQGDMPLVQSRADRTESLRRHLRMTEELRQSGVDFVVWSEAAILLGIPVDGHDALLQQLFTRKLGIPAVFGTELIDRSGRTPRAFNVALSTDASGHVTGRYDKQFLLAFGEYLPFGETFPVLYEWSPNSGHLSPGTSLDPLSVLGHPVTALVCYEDILPAFVNGAVRHGKPHMLVNLTNDAWFGDTTEPWIHLALAKLRAIEHRRYLVRSTNSGVSAVVDPVGRVVANGGTFRPETVQATAHWLEGGMTGYEGIGDIPWWAATAAIGLMALRARRRRTTDMGGAPSETPGRPAA